MVWQDLQSVDVYKIILHCTLQKYKSINRYTKTFPCLALQTAFTWRLEDYSNNDKAAERECVSPTVKSQPLPDNEPMVRKNSKEELYANYTLQSLHAPTLNQIALVIYIKQNELMSIH